MKQLTQERLKEVLHYNPTTGVFCWLISPARAVKAGEIAGGLSDKGYWRISIDGKRYKAHRLAWLYVHGYFPEHGIDHKDRNRHHNWIKNLREATQTCNLRNTGTPKNNTSGVKGVCWDNDHREWRAKICVNRKQIYLGLHTTIMEAACHRLAAEQAEDWQGCDSSSPAYKFVMAGLKI